MDRFIDIHCHPSLKPFGKACPGNTNNTDASLPDSIWHNDPPTIRDKMLNRSLRVARFSQSSFTDLHLGKFKIVVVALYPIEKGFFSGRIGTRDFADIIYNFPAGIGKKKVDFIQENNDDFSELNCEYDYYRQLDDIPLKIYGKDVRYRLTSNFNDLESNLASPEDVISVVLSIEGAGSFSNDISRPPDQNILLSNIDKVKRWQHPPLFVSLCHHFDNYMAGHACSFPRIIRKLVDQTPGIDTGINSCGEAVIRRLLDENDGRRIYIDIKHMSRKSRIRYYEILYNEYDKEKIPIIVSHGALNGRPFLNDGNGSRGKRDRLFDGRDINFYDDEIVMIAESKGIFGLQLDKRHIASKRQKLRIKWLPPCRIGKLRRWTRLVWKQVEHIADVLDERNLPAWDIICLGTDFDGIVSPMEGYLTSADIPFLYKNLRKQSVLYLRHKIFNVPANKLLPREVMNKLFFDNAYGFFKRYY